MWYIWVYSSASVYCMYVSNLLLGGVDVRVYYHTKVDQGGCLCTYACTYLLEPCFMYRQSMHSVTVSQYIPIKL